MSSNLFSDSSKLLSIQSLGAFPPFLCLLPHKSCRWWNSQSWPKSFAPSAANSLCSHPLQTWLSAAFSHIATHRAQDVVGEWCVPNADPYYIKSNVLIKDQGSHKRSPISIFHFGARVQLLAVFIPKTAGWLRVLYVFWAVSTHKRIRSTLLRSIESRDFTLPNQHGLCFVEPRYQPWE